jgi:hypothetical protein
VTLLQPEELFAVLDRHQVEYVLIGGLAAVLHGSPLPTVDADICPARDPNNVERLAAALQELEARLRTPDAPEGVPFPIEPAFLGQLETVNLVTRRGDLDVAFKPAGTAGFDDLRRAAQSITIGSLTVRVASLDDVIRSKEAANRAKDRRALPMLRQLREEIRKRRPTGG